MSLHRLPSVFISHGAPTFAVEPGMAGPALTALGRALPRPEAVLVVSPHWMTATPQVSLAPRQDTIHDFGGFDPALYRITYPVAGHPALAQRAIELLRAAGLRADADANRGLDHGAWVPLLYLYPDADVPVFQVSLPARLDAESAWSFGNALAPLADDGVLIVGSGSITHNLEEFFSGQRHDQSYAVEFAAWIRAAVVGGDGKRLRAALDIAPHARRAHPTPEHFWPLLVAAGAADATQPASVIDGGVAYGMLSMDGFVFGAIDAGTVDQGDSPQAHAHAH